MKAKIINEVVNFQRGLDPKTALGVGMHQYLILIYADPDLSETQMYGGLARGNTSDEAFEKLMIDNYFHKPIAEKWLAAKKRGENIIDFINGSGWKRNIIGTTVAEVDPNLDTQIFDFM